MGREIEAPAAGRRLVPALWIGGVALALYTYQALLVRPLGLPDGPGGERASTLFFMLFSLLHASYTLSWRSTLIFFALSASISWAFEQVGVATGLIYGAYHYSDVLGPRLGHVPLLIPLAWFMMIYPSYLLANLIAQGEPLAPARNLRHAAGLALLSAAIMTAWDLLVDPLMSGPVGAWTWEQGGLYFGVPLHNYVGWLLTTFTIYLIYRLVEQRLGPRPQGPLTRGISLLAVAAYLLILVPYLFSTLPGGVKWIGGAAMAVPAAWALFRLPGQGTGQPASEGQP